MLVIFIVIRHSYTSWYQELINIHTLEEADVSESNPVLRQPVVGYEKKLRFDILV